MESTTVQRLLLVTVVVLATVVTPGECLIDPNLPNIFYPFGEDEGDTIGPIKDDGYTPAVTIPGGFPFFGSRKNRLYVNLNGAFTFDVSYGGFTPTAFPIDTYSVVAPYWADVDVRRNSGRLYYRTETGTDVLTRASNDVRATFSTQCLDTFSATWVFIATWHKVTYFGGSATTPLNSFQGVLVTDGTRTFSIFNYGTLTWTTGTASGGSAATGLGGTAAQVGFNAGNSVNYYTVPASRTNAIVNIYQQTNVGVIGRWMFRTDLPRIGPAGCVLNPTTCDLNSANGLCVGTGTCSFQGDPHYVSFDGKRFDYQGTCKYLVAKPKVRPPATTATTLPYFEVYARSENRFGQTSVAYVRYVEIVYGGETIRLSRTGSTWDGYQYGVVNVKVNGVQVNTPRCSCGNDYSIYQIGFFMRFITTWGLVVEYDGYSQVNVNVPPIYNGGKLTGICGDFNGAWNNDATECNGQAFTGSNINSFGDKCVVNDNDADRGTSCPAPPAPTDPCLTNPTQSYVTRCGQLKSANGPFATCIARLDAQIAGTSTQLYNDCILDACLSNGEAICSNVRSLVDTCADLGIQVDCDQWQLTTSCPVTCPAGSNMVFQCNPTTVCHPTCNNPRVSTTCTRPNRAACVCPAGTLLDNGVCVQVCPGGCVDNTGAFRQAGESWSASNCRVLTCQACPTCPSRFRVVTASGCQSNQVCVNSQCVTPQPAVCWCAGDPHCSTFDSLALINYQGTCEYLLAGVVATSDAIKFQVYSQSDHYFSPNNPTVAYVSRVRLVIGTNEVLLERAFNIPWVPVQLKVNGAVRRIPYSLASTYTVSYAGLSVRIQTTFGVSVEYDGWTRVSVLVPPAYNNQLTGLCGNYDGNSANDWTTADGTDVSNDPDKTNLLGDSFIVADTTTGCSQSAPVNPNADSCTQYAAISTLCTNSIQHSADCGEALGSSVVSQFIAACILDGCLADQATTTWNLAVCFLVSQFYEQCQLAGVTVPCAEWQNLGCGAVFADSTNGRCPTGLTYRCDAPACTATCDNRDAPTSCTLPNREGCVCPEGQFLKDGTCYATCPTGCEDGAIIRPFGSTWTDPTTCASKTCVVCATCFQGSNIISTPCSGSCVSGTCVTAIAVCSAYGDPHYTTFDDQFFTYQGLCKYKAAGVVAGSTLPAGFQTFQIYSRNERRAGWSPSVTFVNYVEIVVGEFTVRLSRSATQAWSWTNIPVDLTVSGRPFSIPFGGSQYPFKVYYRGSTVRLQTVFGVGVEFDGSWTLDIFIPETQYDGLVEGICGNNDGQATNDWTLANGTSVRGNANAVTLLGDSFIVANDPEVLPAIPCPTTPLPVQNPCIPCPLAHSVGCSPIKNSTGLFADCINNIGIPASLAVYADCLFDACYSNGTSMIYSVRAFARHCEHHGWPAPCPLYRLTPYAAACPSGMTYQCGVTSCPATCAEPDAPRTCLTPPIDACACPSGQFIYRGRCVATCPTGCVDPSLQFHEVGTWWRGSGCTVYRCVSAGDIQTSNCLDNERCTESNTCVQDERTCHCRGDPHCVTFDGLFFDYQGICRYTLSNVKTTAPEALPKFAIYSKNEYRNGVTSVAWVKYVELQIDGGDTIRLVGNYQSPSYIAVTTLVNYNIVYPPFVGDGYTIDLNGPFVVIRTTFGVRVSFDGRVTLSVTVPATRYSGQLFGLCGNNDGNTANDYTLLDGTDVTGQPNAPNLLGDSFVVTDITNPGSCPAPPPPTPCGPTTPFYSTFVSRCGVLRNSSGPFSALVNFIGATVAATLYDDCLLDACFTNGTSICPTIRSILDLIISGSAPIIINSCSVLQSTGCGALRTCPTGMTYRCDAPGCPATCTNPNPTCTLPDRDSCVCPAGQFLHNGQCVTTCPRGCFDRSLQFRPIGAVWRGTGCLTYICTACANCANGAEIVEATCAPGELCSRNQCIPPTATCSCQGDPHCTTFDNLRFDYQGICKYDLASVKTQLPGRPYFRVYARHEHRYGQTNVAYVKYVEIVYGGDTVRLVGNYLSWSAVPVNVLLNSYPLSVVNPFNGNGYVISNYGSAVRFRAPSIGLVVTLDRWSVSVTVPNSFVSKLTGLCGNFDGLSANDLTTADGDDVSAQPPPAIPANLVGDSFVIEDPELAGGNAQCPAPAPPTPCTPSAAVRDRCLLIYDPTHALFGRCIGALGQAAVTILYQDCILDACNTNSLSVCFSINSFVTECNRLGFAIPCGTWQQATGCATVLNACPAGMIFQCATSGCQPTCENPLASRNCSLPATSGCVCPSGQLLLGGVCTSVCPTGCVDINGLVRPAGTSWQVGNCQTATCVDCPTCLLRFRIQLTGNCCGTQRCVNNRCV